MRPVFGKLTAYAVASILACAGIAGCSSTQETKTNEGPTSSVGFNLDVGPGIQVDSVAFTVFNSGGTQVASGSIPTAGAGTSFNFAISLPPGTNYRIVLSASTPDGLVSCAGEATFSVVANQSSTISVSLFCDDTDDTGDTKVDVDVVSNVCPLHVNFAAAFPSTIASTSGSSAVTGSATDRTGGAFNYLWTATGGTFANPASASTSFSCNGATLTQTLTLTATRVGTGNQTCSDSLKVWVNCRAVDCGNGTINPPETCDDGNTTAGDGCPADCTLVCGDGILEEAEQCDPPNGVTCNSSCQRIIGCGNGIIEAGEACDDANSNQTDGCRNCQLPRCGDLIVDPPAETCDDGNTVNTDACRNNCTTPRCGDGIVDTGEICDDGNTIDTDMCRNNCTPGAITPVCGNGQVQMGEECDPNNTPSCSNDCQSAVSASCLACESTGPCLELIDGCNLVEGNAADGTPRRNLCYDVLECALDTNCARSAVAACYCGNVDTLACGSLAVGAPAGACARVIERAMETNIPADVLTNFGNLSVGGGWAIQRLICDNGVCNSACFTQ